MNYLLDGIVIIVLLIYTVSCTKKGFIECLFGLISTIVAFAAAYLFSNTLLELTDGFFGLMTEIGLTATSAISWDGRKSVAAGIRMHAPTDKNGGQRQRGQG